MSDNFGLGAFGLDTIEYPNSKESKPIFPKESFEQNQIRKVQLEQLKNLEKYYLEHPESILPSGEYGSKSHRDANGGIVMELTRRR